jgi:hypothetical protein
MIFRRYSTSLSLNFKIKYMPNLDFPDGDFDQDNLDLWNNLGSDDYVGKLLAKAEQTQRKRGEDPQFLRSQLQTLVEQAKFMVKDSTNRRKTYTKQEAYFKANEARVVAIVYKRVLDSLVRILDGHEALPKEVPPDQQTLNIE